MDPTGKEEGSPLMSFEMAEAPVRRKSLREEDLESGALEEAEALCRTAGCLMDPQSTALTALRARQARLFADAVSDQRFSLDHVYVEDDGVPRGILSLAVEQWSSRNDTPFVALLLASGADVCMVDEATEVAVLHQVMRKSDPGLLEACLPHVQSPNVQDGEGLTPLHSLMEQLQEADEPGRAALLRMARAFLERCPGVEVNSEDLRGQLTPLYYAASAGSADAVRMLLEHGADPSVEIEGSSIKQIIEENIGKDFDFLAYADKVKSRPLKQQIFNCCESGDVNGLRRLAFAKSNAKEGGDSHDWNCDNGAMTPMQMACTHGHDNVVSFLLDQTGCDPNAVAPGEGRAPVLIAAHHGYYKILDAFKRCPLVDFAVVEKETGKTVLHEVFRGDSAKVVGGLSVPNSSYSKSLKVLLGKGISDKHPDFERQISRIINYQESLDKNTALHYATMQPDQEVIKALLGRGANMGVKNMRDRPAVGAILPDTLREFLDGECIDGDGVVTDEDFKVTFRYNFLAPPVLGPGAATQEEDEEGKREEQQEEGRALPETEALWYLSNTSREHRSLLKHPVIASFLWLKWQRIRTIFYVNMLLYIAFVVLLTSFIIIRFGGYGVQPTEVVTAKEVVGVMPPSKNSADSTVTTVLSVPIACLLVVLLLREVFQMLVSFKRYFLSPENLLEITIIVLACIIVFDGESGTSHFQRNRHLAALCVLLTWTECLVLVGRHPRLSTNVTMFATVVGTFLKFLLWYGIIVVAFGIAFYIMLHADHADPPKGSDGESRYEFFDSFWIALFKTSAMFVGELEFSDIPYTDNVISYLVFLAFIFLVVVVLMNLLNGLAVSDTGLIREEAEVVGWSARVDLITYTESMLLGDPFYFLSNWPPIRLLQRIPSCAVCRFLYKYPRVRDALQKVSGGTKILLFYTCLPNRRASFFPNRKSSRSFLRYKKSLKVEDGEGAGREQQKLFISNDVLDSAKIVLLERMKADREAEERKAEQEELSNRLLLIEEMLLQMQRQHQKKD